MKSIDEISDASGNNDEAKEKDDIGCTAAQLEHANRMFEYIKYLNQIEDNRSRAMIMVNGLLLTFLGLFARDIQSLSSVQAYVLIIAFIFSAISLAISIRIFWPVTDDELSPIHHSGIRQHKSWKKYSNQCLSISEKEIITQVCREAWVVAGIVKWRGVQVKWSAMHYSFSLIFSIALLVMHIIYR